MIQLHRVGTEQSQGQLCPPAAAAAAVYRLQVYLRVHVDHVWFYYRPSSSRKYRPHRAVRRYARTSTTSCWHCCASLSLLYPLLSRQFQQNVRRVFTRCCTGIQANGHLFTAVVTLTFTRGSPLSLQLPPSASKREQQAEAPIDRQSRLSAGSQRRQIKLRSFLPSLPTVSRYPQAWRRNKTRLLRN